MTKDNPDPKNVLRAAKAYPAIFVPNPYGGFDIYFPNFPTNPTFAASKKTAAAAAKQTLTDLLTVCFQNGDPPPRPSDIDRLIPDEDEPPGTVAVMVEPDTDGLLDRLGLKSKTGRRRSDR